MSKLRPSETAPASLSRPVTEVPPTGRRVMAGMIPDVIVSGVLPIVLTNVLLANGVAAVPALVAGAIFPLGSNLFSLARTRRASVIGVITLAFIVLGAVSSLLSGDPRFTLAKNSAFTGVYGLIYLATLCVGKPLMFTLGRQFVAGNDPDKLAHWNGMWQYPAFRRVQRLMTSVWGGVLLAEAAVRIALVYLTDLPVNAMQLIAEVMTYAVIFALIAWTVWYGKRAAASGERRRQEALAAQHVGNTVG